MINNIQGDSHQLSGDFSTETVQARRESQDIFNMMKGKKLQPRTLYLQDSLFRFNGEIKPFPDK